MAKKKKVNIKLLIVLLVLLVIVLLIIYIRMKLHDREHIRNRLLKGINNLNYSYNFTSSVDYTQSKSQVFGTKEKVTASNGDITYIDYGIGKTLYLSPSLGYMEEQSNKGLEDVEYYNRYIRVYFDNTSTYDYKYKGKEEYNGNKCTKVELISRSELDGRKDGVIFWINDELNLIEKAEFFIERDKNREVLDTMEIRVHTGENNASDVTVPNNIESEYSDNTNN